MHALVLDGQILREHNFGDTAPPMLAPNKGQWLAVADPGEPPFDPANQSVNSNIALVAGVPTRLYNIVTRPVPAPRWTPLQFIERFTEAEQIAIVTAAQSSPALRLWYDKAMASQEVVSDDPRTVAGMDALVAAGLISEARKAEVLGL